MGLFGSKENPEDMKHDAMSMMERNQPKAAVSLFNKILKQNATDDPTNTSAKKQEDMAKEAIKKFKSLN